MSLRLLLLERHLPEALRRRIIRELARLTADGLAVPGPAVGRLSAAEALAAFACFTRDAAARVLADPLESAAARERLRERAREMGALVRRRLAVRTPAEAARALRLLYRAIGIDIAVETRRREIVISRCAFADYYTPAICEFISVLDAGIVHGLTGGASLEFTERITEGARACRARLTGWSRP